jgi:hypothetical protein
MIRAAGGDPRRGQGRFGPRAGMIRAHGRLATQEA